MPGNTTFSLCLAGLLKHTGTVRIDGKKIAHKKLPEQVYLVMQEAGHQLFSDTVLGELTLNNPALSEEKGKEVLTTLGLNGMENPSPLAPSPEVSNKASRWDSLCMKPKTDAL